MFKLGEEEKTWLSPMIHNNFKAQEGKYRRDDKYEIKSPLLVLILRVCVFIYADPSLNQTIHEYFPRSTTWANLYADQ